MYLHLLKRYSLSAPLCLFLVFYVETSYGQYLKVNSDSCPPDYVHASADQALQSLSEACSVIAPGDVVRLKSEASLSGTDALCAITETDLSSLSYSLCVKEKISCAPGFQFVHGQNTQDHCAPVQIPEDLLSGGLDDQSNDICSVTGKGNFSHYQYLYAPPSSTCPETEFLENLSGQIIETPAGTKTLFCDEKVQPLYNDDNNIIACPFGAELVKGQTADNHCAFYWEDSGQDIEGNNVCRSFGGFKEYQYRKMRDGYAPESGGYSFYCDNTGQFVSLPEGSKTIICQQEQFPEYSDNSKLLSCPGYTIKIVGHSDDVPDHCAFIDSHLWYGISPELDEHEQLQEVDICYDLGRGDALQRLVNDNGDISLLCSIEDFPHPLAITQAIAADPSGIQCDAPGQEYIAGNSDYNFVTTLSHCAWQSTSPNFIAEGLDVDNVNVCGELSTGISSWSKNFKAVSFSEYVFTGGVKTIKCSCTGLCGPPIKAGDRYRGEN